MERYLAREHSSCCCRACCGAYRAFDMDFSTHPDGEEVMRLDRPYRCCLSTMDVFSGGQRTGSVEQRCTCCIPVLETFDHNHHMDYRATGECCTCYSQTFTVTDTSGSKVGKVKKNWSGLKKELFTDADTFSIHFPDQADASKRATLLGALFLIDFLYYEDNQNNN
mmetsp:Transcript_6083/g.15433  ORF Transcript_6083/g.15433 Transcript_6083/m.15433 type:complete len:166 (-) Transcript_6083:1080-1577(-)